MLAQKRVVFSQFKALRIVAAVLVRDVNMAAFGAAHLDVHPIAFFRHAA